MKTVLHRCATGALLLLSVVLLAGCEQAPPAGDTTLRVAVMTVGDAVAQARREFHGRVVPADLTKVAFRIDGQVTELEVQAGQTVRRGQVIARLDDTIPKQVLRDARAQYQLSNRQLQRAQDLYKRGTLTTANLDQMRAAFRLARARLKQAEAGLSYTVVRAPFDGAVDHVMKELYEPVIAGETVATVYRTDRTDVLVDLPDSLPARASETQNVRSVEILAQFGDDTQPHPMRLLKASTARNPATQSFEYWLTMSSDTGAFPPGMTVTLGVDLEGAGFATSSGYLVPLTALEAGLQPGSFRVWRLQDGVVNTVPVSVGPITEAGALVLTGVEQGDVLVTTGLARLNVGQRVKIARGEQ